MTKLMELVDIGQATTATLERKLLQTASTSLHYVLFKKNEIHIIFLIKCLIMNILFIGQTMFTKFPILHNRIASTKSEEGKIKQINYHLHFRINFQQHKQLLFLSIVGEKYPIFVILNVFCFLPG
jgi:hypothetical protein